MWGDGFRHDLLTATRIVWIILGAISGIAVLAPFLLGPETLFSLFPVCQAKTAGRSCILCGMTTAFVSIGRGDLQGARFANGGSITVYIVLLVNFLAVLAYTIMRVKRHADS